MAQITYEDKNNTLPTSDPKRLVRAVDLNEIKNVVNANESAAQTQIASFVYGETPTGTVTLSLNTPVQYHYNAYNDSLVGLGYPSAWEIRTGVFYKTFIKESSTTEAHVYGTLDTL